MTFTTGLLAASHSGAPSVSTSAGPGAVTVSWTHPGVARFPVNVYRNGVLVATVGAGVNQYTDTVAAGTYAYQVGYVKNNTVPLRSTSVNGQSLALGPNAPTLTSLVSSVNGLTLTAGWTNAGSYTTRVYTVTAGPVYTLVATAGPGATSVSFDTASATTYYVVLRHWDGSNESANSNQLFQTTNLGAPTSILAVASSHDEVNASWSNTDTTANVDVLRNGSLVTTLAAGSTFYAYTGLTANTQYTFAVRYSKNGILSSQSSTTAYTKPQAPSGVTVSNSSAPYLQWTNTHSLPVYIYRNGGFLTQVNVGVTAYSDTAVASGVSYTYTLRHYNSTSGLQSNNSNAAEITTTVPVPQNVVLSASAGPTVTVTWTNGTTGVVTYVERSLSQFSGYSLLNGGGSTSPYNDTAGLESATVYWYRLRHFKDGTYSDYTTPQSVMTIVDPLVSFSYVSSTQNAVSMSWPGYPNANHAVQIYRRQNATTANETDAYVGEFTSPTTSTTNSGLSPATAYAFAARYRVGSGYSTFKTFHTGTKPSDLISVVANRTGPQEIALTITKQVAETITVNVEYNAGSSWIPWTIVQNADFDGSGVRVLVDAALQPNTTYQYRATPRFHDLGSVTHTGNTSPITSATTLEGSPSVDILSLSSNHGTDEIGVNFTGYLPASHHYYLEWTWLRYDSLNNLVDSGSGNSGTIYSSPYTFTLPVDILNGPVADGDTVIVDVTARVRDASYLIKATDYASIFVDTWSSNV